MAAHQRAPDRSRQEQCSGTDDAVREDPSVASADGTTDGTAIAAAVEREELRVRIRTLERELVASERRRRDLIEQYERLLAERDPTDGAGTDRSVLRGLLAPGR